MQALAHGLGEHNDPLYRGAPLFRADPSLVRSVNTSKMDFSQNLYTFQMDGILRHTKVLTSIPFEWQKSATRLSGEYLVLVTDFVTCLCYWLYTDRKQVLS